MAKKYFCPSRRHTKFKSRDLQPPPITWQVNLEVNCTLDLIFSRKNPRANFQMSRKIPGLVPPDMGFSPHVSDVYDVLKPASYRLHKLHSMSRTKKGPPAGRLIRVDDRNFQVVTGFVDPFTYTASHKWSTKKIREELVGSLSRKNKEVIRDTFLKRRRIDSTFFWEEWMI